MLDSAKYIKQLTAWAQQDPATRVPLLERAARGEKITKAIAQDVLLPSELTAAELRALASAAVAELLGRSYQIGDEIDRATKKDRGAANDQRASKTKSTPKLAFLIGQGIRANADEEHPPSTLAILEDKLGTGRARVYVASCGEAAIAHLAGALSAAEVKLIVELLSPEAIRKLVDVDAARIPALIRDLGAENVDKAAPIIGGAGIARLYDLIGSDAAAWTIKRRSAEKLALIDGAFVRGHRALADQPPLEKGSLVIDTNTALAVSKRANGEPIHDGERKQCAFIDARKGLDVRLTNVTVGEISGRDLPARGVPLVVSRESNEYRALIAKLEAENVGTAKGGQDRGIIADVLFAKVEAGVTPAFATQDKQVYNSLARLAGINVHDMGAKTIPDLYPDGFLVEVIGRRMLLVPIKNPGAG